MESSTLFQVNDKYAITDGYVEAVGKSWIKSHKGEGAIYTHFERVHDEKSLLKFAHVYGLPGLGADRQSTSFQWTPPGYSSFLTEKRDFSRIKQDFGERRCFYDRVDEIISEAYVMRYIHTLFDTGYEKRSKKEDFSRADKIISNAIYNNIKIHRIVHAQGSYYWDSSEVLALKYMNAHLTESQLQAHNENGVYTLHRTYDNMMSAIWFQFFNRLIAERRETKECPACRSLHEGQGKYCPPDEFSKDSACLNRQRQRNKRKRDKEKKKNPPHV